MCIALLFGNCFARNQETNPVLFLPSQKKIKKVGEP